MSPWDLLVYLAAAYYFILYSVHLLHLLVGYRAARRWKKMGYIEEAHRLSRSGIVPPLTLVSDINFVGDDPELWVDRVLSQRFPEIEVLIIFRQRGDIRVKKLIDAYFLRRVDRAYRRVLDAPEAVEVYQSDDRRLTLARTHGEAGGASLNLALNLARYPLFAVADRGAWLEDDALLCMMRPFMEGGVDAPAVVGLELPLDSVEEGLLPPRRITRFALMESLRVQLGFVAGAPQLAGPATTYASLTVFHRDDLLQAGGFKAVRSCMEAEMDMTLRLQRLMHEQGRPYRFAFIPRVVARRAFPRTLRECFDEYRERHAGVSLALSSGMDMLFRPRYGRLGMVQMPSFWLFVRMAPLIGFTAFSLSILLFSLGLAGWQAFVAFLACSMLFPGIVGVGAVAVARREMGVLKGQGAALYGYAFLTQFWFRQLTALAALFGPPRHGMEVE